MQIDLKNSISEENRDFSNEVRMVDENRVAGDAELEDVAARILKKHVKAFEELAK